MRSQVIAEMCLKLHRPGADGHRPHSCNPCLPPPTAPLVTLFSAFLPGVDGEEVG